MIGEKCCQCEAEARLFEDDGTGYCLQDVIAYATEELNQAEYEKITGISHLDIVNVAIEKKISLEDARKELETEKL